MKEKFNLKKLLKQITTSPYILNCNMPLGYVAGYPIIKKVRGKVCIVIPYLKYKVTSMPDKTQVFPIKYTVTFAPAALDSEKKLVPSNVEKKETLCGHFVGFEDLSYNPIFDPVDFTKPIGFFRHKAVKDLSKEEYSMLRDELYGLYDKIINAELNGDEIEISDKYSFKQLISKLLEPSLLYMYKMIDEEFYNRYLR